VTYRHPSALERSLKALEDDLLRESGPQISTTWSYNFAILPYSPEEEYALRAHMHRLSDKLRSMGWTVGQINLHALLLGRVRAMGEAELAGLIASEKRNAKRGGPARGLALVKERVTKHLEDAGGLAADVVREVQRLLAEHPDHGDRVVLFLARAGALYPFMRTSALLKHIAGRIPNVPVVLLYPGTRAGEGLSFMGILPADHDYRPRIYW
jgi:hypothetical protein